jgi:hypothetical protein
MCPTQYDVVATSMVYLLGPYTSNQRCLLSTLVSNEMEHVFNLLGNQLLKKVRDADKKIR